MSNDLPQMPGYFALRLGADLASGARGTTLYFDYGNGMLEITDPPPSPAPPPPVPVFSRPSGKRRFASEAAMTVVGADGAPYGSILLNARAYSALFWSESAVEKFLLPYYASAGGPHAYQVVHAINKVWYNFPDAAPVCALAFTYPPDALQGQWTLWDTVHVLHVQGEGGGQEGVQAPYVVSVTPGSAGQLAMTPLLQYLQPFTPLLTELPQPADPIPTALATSGTERTRIDSVGAREVAEYVSGLRGFDVYVYQVEAPGGLEATLTQRVQPTPPLFEATSPYVRTGRPSVSVALSPQGLPLRPLSGTGSGDAAKAPDSVFWSDGSVDMLLLPYYGSVQGKGSPWYLMVLLWKWAGIIPVDVTDAVELLELIGEQVQREIGVLRGGEPQPEPDSTVFAIIHLPNSDWVDEQADVADPILRPPPPIWLENRTAFLTEDGRLHPLVSTGRRLVPLGV